MSRIGKNHSTRAALSEIVRNRSPRLAWQRLSGSKHAGAKWRFAALQQAFRVISSLMILVVYYIGLYVLVTWYRQTKDGIGRAVLEEEWSLARRKSRQVLESL
jgi:hypothetical protein